MSSPATEQSSPVEQDLPNKFIYPEFAGFAGEERLHEIVTLILPVALLRTWEIFERKHAYDNDCYLSLGKVTRNAGRTPRTIRRHIATFMARNLLVLRPGWKFHRRADGSMFKKGVTIKDFSGLYALAHEYYLWLRDEEQYLEPEFESLVHIQGDPRLRAKLCRFENYRRLLEHQRDPFAQIEEDRRFTEYDPDASYEDEEHAENVEESSSGQNGTKILPKEQPNEASKVSHKRINEKAYANSLSGDSLDSDAGLERGGGADATRTSISKTGTRDYTKQVREDKTGTHTPNESETNPVPLSPKNVPPAPGKTSVSDENMPEVQSARSAMVAFGIVPGQSVRHQAEELPPPPKHPLARSFVHEVSGLFGDLNEKGSKTGIERRIEDFELDQPMDVLLCLVRAYVVARDTKDEKIRQRRPDGKPNRMPLFCTMFERFAQALGPGNKWQYTYQQMFEAIAADSRLELWVSEHQVELAGGGSDQVEASQSPLAFVEELSEEEASEAGEEPEGTLPDDEDGEEYEEEEEFAEDNEEPAPEEEEEEFADDTEEQGLVEGEEPASEEDEEAQEEGSELISVQGWKTREMAYDWAAYLLEKLIENDYGDLEVSVSLPRHGDRYQIIVQNAAGTYYCLVCREDIRGIMAMARKRTLFVDPAEIGN